MAEKTERFTKWLTEQINTCNQQQKALLEEERSDEATFEKIKANVYDVFRTVLSVAVKTTGGNPDAVKQFFLTKTEQIPANWHVSYQKAQEHGDVEKMQIETIKLRVIQEIKTEFLALWEEEK